MNTQYNEEPKNYEKKFIVQRLDNFDDKEKRTFKNLYYQDVHNFQQNGPIYLYVSEFTGQPFVLPTLTVNTLATETHGAVIVPEIRYYGSSVPLNTSDIKNLKYMTSQQVLADLVHLVKTIKSQSTYKDSKVVVMGGGSGGGNLAAEMRYKYPDIVDCAWVSSAPVLAKKDFYEFLEQAGKNYLTYGSKQCNDKIVKIYTNLQETFKTAEGINKLKKTFNICNSTDMTKPLNQENFYSFYTYNWFLMKGGYGSPDEIKFVCDWLKETDDVGISRVSNLMENDKCWDLEINNFYVGTGSDYHVWKYQHCTEYGYFYAADSNDQPFGKRPTIEYYMKLCSLLIGPDFKESSLDNGVAYHNKYYGGQTPDITKAIFLNYVQDPWRVLGVTKSLNDDAPVVWIEGSRHMQDLYLPNPARPDPKSLVKAREYAEKMVKHWVGLGPRPAPYNTTIVHDQIYI
ncbi:serine carboxypeptidase s28 domain-containing protein [Phthorimaea operculella]|nr:serine carboxypeptidase s28 domain-containing protein [Phthorimaea operculella]